MPRSKFMLILLALLSAAEASQVQSSQLGVGGHDGARKANVASEIIRTDGVEQSSPAEKKEGANGRHSALAAAGRLALSTLMLEEEPSVGFRTPYRTATHDASAARRSYTSSVATPMERPWRSELPASRRADVRMGVGRDLVDLVMLELRKWRDFADTDASRVAKYRLDRRRMRVSHILFKRDHRRAENLLTIFTRGGHEEFTYSLDVLHQIKEIYEETDEELVDIFQRMANKYSKCLATGDEGGDLGWVSPGRKGYWWEDFDEHLFPEDVRQTPEPGSLFMVSSSHGGHLVLVTDWDDARMAEAGVPLGDARLEEECVLGDVLAAAHANCLEGGSEDDIGSGSSILGREWASG